MEQGTDSMDPHTTYQNKGDVIWALGPKAKHEIMRGQWGNELKDISLQELLKLFKKTFLPTRNVFHSRAQFFNIKQEDGETLDEYWKRLVDIERKCEFNTITPEDIITYKFAATINDEKAGVKFIKGPLKLSLILETIELDNYNRITITIWRQTNNLQETAEKFIRKHIRRGTGRIHKTRNEEEGHVHG